MVDGDDNEFDDLEVAVEFKPLDDIGADLLRQYFVDGELFESNAFSGAWVFTLIVSASKGAIGKVLNFFAQHRQRFKDASIKIGAEEISLAGYSIEEIEGFLDSPSFRKTLRSLKKK